MTQSEKYTKGQWYGWNGGECPVHPRTTVAVVTATSTGGFVNIDENFVHIYKSRLAGDLIWSRDDETSIIAFRVVKHHVEPRVIWVNEYDGYGWLAHKTKEEAILFAGKYATRIAVRYVETPE